MTNPFDDVPVPKNITERQKTLLRRLIIEKAQRTDRDLNKADAMLDTWLADMTHDSAELHIAATAAWIEADNQKRRDPYIAPGFYSMPDGALIKVSDRGQQVRAVNPDTGRLEYSSDRTEEVQKSGTRITLGHEPSTTKGNTVMRTGPVEYTYGLGEVIRGYRMYIGLGKGAMAAKLGIAERSYERIENGERACPPGFLDSISNVVKEFDEAVEMTVAYAPADPAVFEDRNAEGEWRRAVVGRAAVLAPHITPALLRSAAPRP